MPDGKTHYIYYKRGFMVSIPISILSSFYSVKLGLGYICGYGFGAVCDPDWDLVTANNAESRLLKIPILGHFLFGISSFYGSYFFRKHRGFWGHFPFISTAIRLIFVFAVPFIVGDSWGINFIGDGWWKFWAGFYSGLSQADAIHYYLDLTYGK